MIFNENDEKQSKNHKFERFRKCEFLSSTRSERFVMSSHLSDSTINYIYQYRTQEKTIMTHVCIYQTNAYLIFYSLEREWSIPSDQYQREI
jgi:hypothetical protein